MMEPLALSKWTPDTRVDGFDDALRNLDPVVHDRRIVTNSLNGYMRPTRIGFGLGNSGVADTVYGVVPSSQLLLMPC
jgi:hypothetical protein